MRKMLNLFSGLSLLLLSGMSQAYNIYNDSPVTLEVYGETCPACYQGSLQPNTYGSCPGDQTGCKGTTSISFIGSSTWSVCHTIPVPVTNHGWVNITTKDDKNNPGSNIYEGQVYNNSGNLIWSGEIPKTIDYFRCIKV